MIPEMDGTEEEKSHSENGHDSNEAQTLDSQSAQLTRNNHEQLAEDDISQNSQDTNADKGPAAENSHDVIILESDEETYTNPEPPNELMSNELIHADMIGDTMFSKHWLFTTLMNLIKVCFMLSVSDGVICYLTIICMMQHVGSVQVYVYKLNSHVHTHTHRHTHTYNAHTMHMHSLKSMR